jgi:SAM-dependent methyltransferase
LRVALDPSHPRHILPPPFPASYKILDVGCGAGQTLIAAFPDRITFGIDIDFFALRTGSALSKDIRFCCARAESLPYLDGQFDAVIARVSLSYTNLERSLCEIRRVLRPSGTLWMTLHTVAIPWRAARTANWKGKVFFLYVLLNSLVFHIFVKQFGLFGRYESFQTRSGIRRALHRAGFSDVSMDVGRHFVVIAQ